MDGYGRLPLSFEVNRGQAAKQVQFLSRGKGYTLFLSGRDAVLSLVEQKTGNSKFETRNSKLKSTDYADFTDRVANSTATRGHHGPRTTDSLLRMRLVGANGEVQASALDPLPGKVNYFIGKDPAGWRTNVPTYSRVLYKGVYPGVDLVFYGSSGQLEYDFVVAPGADPRSIKLAISSDERVGSGQKAVDSEVEAQDLGPQSQSARRGRDNRKSPMAAPLRITENGDLLVQLGAGEVRFHKPLVYQPTADGQWSGASVPLHKTTDNGPRTTDVLEGKFVLKGSNQVSFEVAAYDRTRPLVIDPTMVYSTYLGGSQGDVGYAIAVDSSANAYIAGQTCSANFPTQAPEQAANAGQCDAFVTKLNPTGTALIYSTYLGGSGGDQASGIAIDSTGNAYVTGITNSTDFPTTAGSFQNTYQGGDSDVFITKLNPAGSALVYSTYLGGDDADSGNAIAIDSSGDAFVTGETYSDPFPTTAGAFQTAYGGRGDAFVTELNPAGTALVYSTYLGGELQDAGNGIAVDNVGSAFVTGSTYSALFPVAHAIQGTCGGYNASNTPPCPARDAFVTKFSADGSALVYSTYLGGSLDDVGTGIALDSLGAAYVAGFTSSSSLNSGIPFPVRPDALQTALAGTQNAFVTKVDPLGGAPFAYSTYLGGSGVDAATAIAVDSNGVAYVTGGTTSPNFPTASPIQPTLAGPTVYPGDAFLSKVNAYGSGLIYSSYLGGGDLDVGNGIAVDSSLAVYITGSTLSTDFPTAPTATSTPACPPTCPFQGAYAGAGDAFVTKMNALTAAVAEFSSRSLSFGPQGLTIPSTPQTVTVTNTGDATLNITQISESGTMYTYIVNGANGPYNVTVDLKDWAVTTDNCTGVPVAPGGNCTFVVTFAPNLTPNQVLQNGRSGTITVADNAVTSSQSIALSGSAVIPPGVTPLPTGLAFNNQLLNTTSKAQTVTLTNSGGFVLVISTITITGPFAETNTCGASLGAGASCTISVTFTPTAPGASTGTLTITDDSTCLGTQAGANPLPCSVSPQTVPLTGTSVPVVTLSETNMTFAAQNVGTTSVAQTVTLTNTGEAPLEITGSGASGDFAQSNTCPSTLNPLPPLNFCTISVTFTPTAPGNRYGAVTITDSAANSPQTIVVSGTGSPGPAISLSATNITFTGQNVGSTSSPQSITLGNIGTAPLSITKIGTSGDFAETNNCNPTLGTSASCAINVTFSPTAAGTRTGALTITDNAPGNPQTVTLTGAGIAAPSASLSPPSLTFASQNVGTTSSALAVTLTNMGSAALSVTGTSVTGDFAQTNNCPSSLAAAANCVINVTFTPTATGNRYGSIALTDNAAGSPQSVALTGVGTAAPIASLAPVSLTFTGQNVGTASSPQAVTLTNSGTATLTLTSIASSGDFTEANNCPPSLAPGTNCSISVTFAPTATGTRTGALTITDNAAGSPQAVSLAGSGIAAPGVSLSSPSLTFAGQKIAVTSPAQTVTVTNSGTAPLTISNSATTGDFAQGNNCPASLAASAHCLITVTFTPTAVGNRYGTLTLTDNASGSPQTIQLSGAGLATPIVSLSANSLSFAGQPLGTGSAAQAVTLSNTGTAALAISSIVTSGDFAQTNNCPPTVVEAASCTINVTFAPTVVGTRSGSLTITDNAPGSPQAVILAGSGADFSLTTSPASLNVIAGSWATYTVKVVPNFGFTGSVLMTCSGFPVSSVCLFGPNPVTPDGQNASIVTMTVTTTARAQAPPHLGSRFAPPPLPGPLRLPWSLWLLGVVLSVSLAAVRPVRRARLAPALGLIVLFVLAWGACGGGSGGGFGPGGTAAGTYTLTISGASGSVTHTTTVTLTVQ